MDNFILSKASSWSWMRKASREVNPLWVTNPWSLTGASGWRPICEEARVGGRAGTGFGVSCFRWVAIFCEKDEAHPLAGNFGRQTHRVRRRDPPRFDRGWALHQRLLIWATERKEICLWGSDRRTGSGAGSFLASGAPKGFMGTGVGLGCSGNWALRGLGCFEITWVEISRLVLCLYGRSDGTTFGPWLVGLSIGLVRV